MDPMDCQPPELSIFSLMNAFVLQLVLVAVFAESIRFPGWFVA